MEIEIGSCFVQDNLFKALWMDLEQLQKVVCTATTTPVADHEIKNSGLLRTRNLHKDKEWLKKAIFYRYKKQLEDEVNKMMALKESKSE